MAESRAGVPTSSAGTNGEKQAVFVSVVIPTYNRRHPLERCLQALVGQSWTHFEIIVVDDCSSDSTAEAIRQWASQHPSLAIKCLENDTNMGANASRNRGIQEAVGPLVAFLDSDCVPEPDWLESLIGAFENEQVAAVTGSVGNPPPANIFELTYRGTNRVVGLRYASRLVGCNMCIRRDLLLRYPLDEDLKYGCDEEGLYRRLKAAGYHQLLVPEARVLHDHRFNGRTLMRQAWIGGAGAAWLVYKYRLATRLDLLPFMLAYATLPLVLVAWWLAMIPAFFFTAALAALAYNELARKGKTILETIRIFPVLLLYYHVRLWGYMTESIALRLGKRRIERVRLQEVAREFAPFDSGTVR